jgi:hypothetical protein
MMRKRWIVSLCLLSGFAVAQSRRELWMYQATNLQVSERVAELEALWRRAAAAGYTHVLLTDSKFARLGGLGSMDKTYFANLQRARRLAEELRLQVVPVVFHTGWANAMLWHDPNLAEGLPVRDAPFVVRAGRVEPVADPAIRLGRPDWADDVVRLEGQTATVADAEGNARFVFRRTLPKYRCYHVAVSIQTEGFSGHPEFKVLADGKSLQYQSLDVRPSQALTRYDLVFNTLEHEKVALYFGAWGGGRGRLVWKDWSLEEAGLVNVLRRDGAPLVVRSDDGTVYEEGRDFEPVADPLLGNVPYKGEYQAWHTPPEIKTRLPEGTRLRISWYHPAIIYGGAVMACLSEPATDALLQDEARRVRKAWGAKGYMMGYDEIRVMNRDASCGRCGLDAGALLAAHARRCAGLLAGSAVYVWNDMFDPFHNARDAYYLVRGDLSGAWEGLAPGVVVVNWNFDKRDDSLAFFAERGHRQIIAAYYDGPLDHVRQWLVSAERVKGVEGVMYTTWRDRYEDLEAFARICQPFCAPSRPR